MDIVSGIYKITNKLNGKCYIGQSVNPEKRWKQHLLAAKGKGHSLLYRAMQITGIDNFEFEVIERTADLEERERYWIEQYHSYGGGYNQTMGGQKYHGIIKPDGKWDIEFRKQLERGIYNVQEETV